MVRKGTGFGVVFRDFSVVYEDPTAFCEGCGVSLLFEHPWLAGGPSDVDWPWFRYNVSALVSVPTAGA